MSKHANKANTNGAGPANTERERLVASDVSRPPSAAVTVPGGSVSRMIRTNWKTIALITVAVAGLFWIIAAMQPDRYQASALAAIAPLADTLQANEVLRGVEVLERRTIVATVAALAATNTTRTQAQAANGYDIEAAVLPNTNLFHVNVVGDDAAQAAAIANRVPALLSAQTRAMYKYYGVTMVSPATTPKSPFLPRPGRALVSGLLIGLFLGLLTAYALQWRSARRGIAT